MDKNELYHYGILGMKWGVRRYQNYDGSYTQKGVKRYYEAKSNYDSAKAKAAETKKLYKRGKVTKNEYKTVKSDVSVSKRKLNKAYGQLKKDKLADQGKEIYGKGKTINGTTRDLAISESAVGVGSFAAYHLLKRYKNEKIATIAATTLTVGGTAVNALLGTKARYEAKRLRAYYTHHR